MYNSSYQSSSIYLSLYMYSYEGTLKLRLINTVSYTKVDFNTIFFIQLNYQWIRFV